MQDNRITYSNQEIKVDGNVVVTSGKVLVVAPYKYFSFVDAFAKMTDKFPAYERVIPQHDRNDVLFEMDSRALCDECRFLPVVEDFVPCDRCEGHGSLYTRGHNKVVCDECDGDGKAEILGVIIPKPKEDNQQEKTWIYNFDGTYFDCNLISEISKIGVVLEQPIKWIRRPDNNNRSALLYIADVLVIVGAYGIDYEDFKGDNVTILELNKTI